MISQKATILCIYEILKKYSDENHIISAEKIREKLKVIYDVDMERRAIYRNIDALRSMGIDIEGYTDNREGYYLIEEGGFLVVYASDRKTVYEYTDIAYDDLPENVRNEIRYGKYIRSQADLYGFLENYSS